ASMSYELRTPLTSIIGNSEIMIDTLLSDEQKQLMSSIEISGRGLLALVNDILDLSKIEAGKFELEWSDFDLNVLINEIEQTFSSQAQNSELQFRIKKEPFFEYQFVGDGRRLGQVMLNLLSNAFKFTEKGGVTLEVWVDQGIHFSVEDSGVGMSAEILECLFQPFEQADQSISRRFGGTGLGLHISRSLLGLMGGEISVESIEWQGSKFEVFVPCTQSKTKAAEHESEVAQLMASHFRGKVLVAEDTEELQILVRRLLERVGAEVAVANNGNEAVALALAEPYDLILMDMQMPEMDGIEATGLLRQVGCDTPIVALTANVMEQHRTQFEQAGCSEFLSKPIDREALMSVLGRYLEPLESEGGAVEDDAVVSDFVDDELLQLFVERTAVQREALLAAYSKQDWAGVRTTAHTVKGSGTTFGFPELTRLGKEICDAIDHQNLEPVPDLVQEMYKKMQEIK
ncbi:MAG: response regulator, partial [Gammaproteobacteria bacterium]|nr:response regulator [Gammaproteobacteria bacterium]